MTDRQVHVVAETTKGEPIESFDSTLGRNFDQYVYNVAGAAPLVRWSAVYGSAVAAPERELGVPRWTTTDATVLFVPPPDRLSGNGGGTTMFVLTAFADGPPAYVLSKCQPAETGPQVIRLHAIWDESGRPNTDEWLHRATALPDFAQIAKARLTRDPHDARRAGPIGCDRGVRSVCPPHPPRRSDTR